MVTMVWSPWYGVLVSLPLQTVFVHLILLVCSTILDVPVSLIPPKKMSCDAESDRVAHVSKQVQYFHYYLHIVFFFLKPCNTKFPKVILIDAVYNA